MLSQFLRFGAVGAFGFVVNTAVLYAARGVLGLYGAEVLAYFIAATANWALNRVWTFRGLSTGALHRQWALFLATNTLGFALNYGTYATLVTVSALCAAEPVIAVAAGSIAGMFANFTLSRRLVFR